MVTHYFFIGWSELFLKLSLMKLMWCVGKRACLFQELHTYNLFSCLLIYLSGYLFINLLANFHNSTICWYFSTWGVCENLSHASHCVILMRLSSILILIISTTEVRWFDKKQPEKYVVSASVCWREQKKRKDKRLHWAFFSQSSEPEADITSQSHISARQLALPPLTQWCQVSTNNLAQTLRARDKEKSQTWMERRPCCGLQFYLNEADTEK